MSDKPAPRRSPNPVPYQLREWHRRAEILLKVIPMLKAGHSLNDASKELGEPIANLSRYVRAFRAKGVQGLLPCITKGVESVASKLQLKDSEAAAIAALSYRVVRRRDIAGGCRAYAAHPDCRPALRAVLTGRIPNSVRAAVQAHLPETEQ